MSRSNINALPTEIIAEMISYIPNKLRPLCELVCTKWKHACTMAKPFNGAGIVGPSVIILACKFGYANIVKREMDRYIKPFLHIKRTTRENRKTIRHVQKNLQAFATWAASGGQIEILQILLDNGLKRNRQITAHASNQLETLKWFRENGFPIATGCWIYTCNVEVLEFLHDKDVPYDEAAVKSHCHIFRTSKSHELCIDWLKKRHILISE